MDRVLLLLDTLIRTKAQEANDVLTFLELAKFRDEMPDVVAGRIGLRQGLNQM